VNIPNGDMVGHTGDLKATIIGCKAADEAVKVLSSSVVAVHATFSNVVDMMDTNFSHSGNSRRHRASGWRFRGHR
jgi:bisphosphoglycerate-independent phosphoglycerate mutase (AlkP superfamily)